MENRRPPWAEPVARMGRQHAYRILVSKPLQNVHLEATEGDGRITLRWTIGRWIWNLLRIMSSGRL
jgi:hypothetical protein